MEDVVTPIVDAFQPELLLVACGQDANQFDPNGRQCLSMEGFRRLGEAARSVAEPHCDGRIVLGREGATHARTRRFASTPRSPACGRRGARRCALRPFRILGAVMRRFAPLFLAALVLAACGSRDEESESARASAPAPQTLPAAALPELDSHARTLDANALADDSLDPEALGDVLVEAGYVTGSEREFSGKSRTFDHVVARTLVFESAAGAEKYLGWLRGHGADFLGRAEAADVTVPGESAVTFALARCGTCVKEVPAFLAGWRRGRVVLWLLAAGSGTSAARFDHLARQVDGVLR